VCWILWVLFGTPVAGPYLKELRLLGALELNYVLNNTGRIGYCVDVHDSHGILFVCLKRLKKRVVYFTWFHGTQEFAQLSKFAHFRLDRVLDSLG